MLRTTTRCSTPPGERSVTLIGVGYAWCLKYEALTIRDPRGPHVSASRASKADSGPSATDLRLPVEVPRVDRAVQRVPREDARDGRQRDPPPLAHLNDGRSRARARQAPPQPEQDG